ncbi:MAG: glycosyltransferase family 4 protein [Longimicrobiales bacterium]
MHCSGPRILALAPDLSGNSTITAWQFRGALVREGYEVTLAGTAMSDPWPPLARELEHAVCLGAPSLWPRTAAAMRYLPRADVVYAFKAHPCSLGLALRLSSRWGVPLALHLDDWDAGFLRGSRRARRVWWALRALGNPDNEVWLRACELLIHRADALTVSTTALQRRFGGTVVRQGVDEETLCPERYPRAQARQRLGVAPDRPMVLFLGTPRRHKGIAALLSLRELSSAVWIVGATERTAEELGLRGEAMASVTLRPPVAYEEAAWYMAACDVFVAPQENSPFAAHQVPAKILKAMALGVAVVTTDVGDAPELLGGDPPAGLIVPPGESQALGEAIAFLLGDTRTRAALGAEARRRAKERYGWKAMGRVLRGVLTPLIGGDAEGSPGLDFRAGRS